jgi:hypothetical protein
MMITERDEQIIQGVSKDTPKIVQPNCPKCRYSPLEFLCNVARTPMGHLVAVIWCGHCGHTLNTQFIGVDQPQIQPAGPMIVRPS